MDTTAGVIEASGIPPVPVQLAHRPVVAGLVVPYVTPQAGDGRWLFGVIDQQRLWQCLTHRWCQICGRPLDRPLVLLLRETDLTRQRISEPGCHPVCAAYTMRACPMVAGRTGRYRSTPVRLDQHMVPASDAPARLGAPAEVWYAVWLDHYDVIIDGINGLPAACFAGIRPRRVRRITPPDQPAPAGHLRRTP
jgi:hypothetical protein